MFLLDPLFLLLWIPLVILAILLLKVKTSRNTVAFTNFHFLRNKANAKYFLPQFFDFLAAAIAIFALARPVTLEKTVTPPVEGKDIMIALDVSGSMEALDFQPKNRITAAKNVIEEFVKGRKSDRLGLVFFAKESFLQIPLTTDYDIFNELLSRVTTGVIEDGTAIGNGLGLALSRLESSKAKSKVIILLTDGDNNSGNISPETAAEMKVRLRVPRLRVSPSFTSILLLMVISSKYSGSIFRALPEATRVVSGYFSKNFAMLPEWSGSMWCTTK